MSDFNQNAQNVIEVEPLSEYQPVVKVHPASQALKTNADDALRDDRIAHERQYLSGQLGLTDDVIGHRIQVLFGSEIVKDTAYEIAYAANQARMQKHDADFAEKLAEKAKLGLKRG